MCLSTSFIILAVAVATGVLAIPAKISTRQAGGLTLSQQLQLATSAASRIDLIPNDKDFVFGFANSTVGITQGKGGKTVRADRDTFPALIGSHGSMTLGFLGPCGFNTPHVHPRAAELNIVVEGRLMSNAIAENGVRRITNTLNKYDMTIFPQGALHTEFNPDCQPAIFVAAFPDENPGVLQIAQAFFGLEDPVVKAAVGGDVSVDGKDLEKFRPLIPANVALGVESCLKKCGIQKR